MQYRELGRTGLEVSEVGFGAWAIGGPALLGDVEIGWGETDDAESLRTVQAALDAGITFFDTADVYGAGHSEVLLGKALHTCRDQVIIASKVGNRTTPDGAWLKDFSKKWILEAVDGTLTRLNTDYIDLYQLHTARDLADYTDDAIDALERLVAAGKIRFYGVSIGPASHGAPVIARWPNVAVLQVVYNMIAREPEDGLLPLAQERGVGIIARVPLASGFLTGKFRPDVTFPPNDHRSHSHPPEKARRIVEAVEQLRFLTRDTRKTLAQAALQYCLVHRGVSTVIPGAKTPAQVRDNAAASDGVLLSGPEVEEVRRVLPGDLTNFGGGLKK